MEVTARKATVEDVDTLVEFNRAMAEETEGKKLLTTTLSAGVRSVFEDPVKGFYLIAEAGGTAVGSLLITTEWSDWRNAHYWWIQSVYVRPEYRARGIYKTLHRHVEETARQQQHVCGIRLYVDRHNGVAKTVYERLGMARTRYELYESGDLRPPDVVDEA